MVTTNFASHYAHRLFLNPFIVGACPLTSDADRILALARKGWAGAVTKTLTSSPPFETNPPTFLSSVRRGKRIAGLLNCETHTEHSLETWCDEFIPHIRHDAPAGFQLIVSIMEGRDVDTWVESAVRVQRAGADLIELNVSCPHGAPEFLMGTVIGDDPEILYEIVSACRIALDIPITVKLNATSTNLNAALVACESGGASGVAVSNTIPAIPPIRIESYQSAERQPHPVTLEWGLSGASIRPITQSAVLTASRKTDLPICGIGGVDDYRSAIEYLLIGASVVQLATAPMLLGSDMISELLRAFESYLNRTESRSVAALIGLALRDVVPASQMIANGPSQLASVVEEHCTLCNRCVAPCRENATAAIAIVDSQLRIDASTCTGCGLCVAICPHDALALRPLRNTAV